MPAQGPSRRRFLRTGVAAVFPMILPAGVLAQPGRPGANDRIITGHIGTGARGRTLLRAMRADAAAVCDVCRSHAVEGAAIAGAGVRVYEDYRRLLDQSDLDAVVIASPDHWHALHVLHACEAGKDIYLEVPLTRHIGDVSRVLDAVKQYDTILSPGVPALAGEAATEMAAFVRDAGAVGRVTAWAPSDTTGALPPIVDPPEDLNWDAWVGPAPWRPYRQGYAQGDWKMDPDWGGGALPRVGVTLLAQALLALGLSELGTVHVEAKAIAEAARPPELPEAYTVAWTLQDHAVVITWQQPGSDDTAACGLRLEGEDTARSWTDCAADDVASNVLETTLVGEIDRWKVGIRSRQGAMIQLHAVAHASVLAQLGNLAWRLERPLTFDADAGRFSEEDAGNRWLSVPGRGPYHW